MDISTLEAVAVPGRISGTSIVSDLLNRIGEKLAHNCDLRQIDAYAGYSARVSIDLQLNDVYPVAVAAEVNVGKMNSQQPSIHIHLGSEVTAEADEPSLERPVVEPVPYTPLPPSLKRLVDNVPPQAASHDNMANHTVPQAVARAAPQGAADGGIIDAPPAGRRQYTPRGATPGARPR